MDVQKSKHQKSSKQVERLSPPKIYIRVPTTAAACPVRRDGDGAPSGISILVHVQCEVAGVG